MLFFKLGQNMDILKLFKNGVNHDINVRENNLHCMIFKKSKGFQRKPLLKSIYVVSTRRREVKTDMAWCGVVKQIFRQFRIALGVYVAVAHFNIGVGTTISTWRYEHRTREILSLRKQRRKTMLAKIRRFSKAEQVETETAVVDGFVFFSYCYNDVNHSSVSSTRQNSST